MSSQLTQIKYVRATEVDPQDIIDFWKRNNITVTPTDSPEEIQVAANLHPQLFIVGLGPDDTIIGTVWGGFDGRRGYVAHLAVDKPYRNQGLGSLLMEKVETEFKKMNVYKVHLFVEQHNAAVGDFYRRRGYKERTDLTVFSKTFR
ncbi:MAG: GNAT family N-acetyltransferase [Spirochaetota bacterium]